MRLDINLATRPYEDAREFWARWGLGVGLLAVLTLFLLGLTVNDWTKAGRDRHEIARLQQQIAERDQERAQAQAFLDLAANRSTRDQSQFLNGLIQRKSFSWTRVFEDLEQVMPPNLHVASLRPGLNEQNQMELEMHVAGDTRAAAVELVHRMEGSKHFQGAQLVQEVQGGESGSNITASVVAIYVPDLAPESASNSAPNSAANSKDRSKK
ncbi:MAG: PilN domain-containing protein [Terriglobales bacterium]|jgi:type IV pilus assembly protein PilN